MNTKSFFPKDFFSNSNNNKSNNINNIPAQEIQNLEEKEYRNQTINNDKKENVIILRPITPLNDYYIKDIYNTKANFKKNESETINVFGNPNFPLTKSPPAQNGKSISKTKIRIISPSSKNLISNFRNANNKLINNNINNFNYINNNFMNINNLNNNNENLLLNKVKNNRPKSSYKIHHTKNIYVDSSANQTNGTTSENYDSSTASGSYNFNSNTQNINNNNPIITASPYKAKQNIKANDNCTEAKSNSNNDNNYFEEDLFRQTPHFFPDNKTIDYGMDNTCNNLYFESNNKDIDLESKEKLIKNRICQINNINKNLIPSYSNRNSKKNLLPKNISNNNSILSNKKIPTKPNSARKIFNSKLPEKNKTEIIINKQKITEENLTKINNNNYDNNKIVNSKKNNLKHGSHSKNSKNFLPKISEKIVNSEITNLFENIPNELANDPDVKEKVNVLMQNINEIKSFIHKKKKSQSNLKPYLSSNSNCSSNSNNLNGINTNESLINQIKPFNYGQKNKKVYSNINLFENIKNHK